MTVAPMEVAGLATLINDPPTLTQVPKGPCVAHATATPCKQAGGGSLWSSEGDGGRNNDHGSTSLHSDLV